MSHAFLLIVDKAAGLRSADFGMFAKSDPYCKITSPTNPAVLGKSTTAVIPVNVLRP